MRGRIDDLQTIYGDILYDWAKILQSLIGYDEILKEKYVSKNYKDKMIKLFKDYLFSQFFIDQQNWNDICWITKSLLITLIPLHQYENNTLNSKCNLYFDLIRSKYLC